MKLLSTVFTMAALALPLSITQAAEIKREPIPNFPISSVVVVPSAATNYYLSGTVPSKEGESFGDTKQQTINVLKKIEAKLKEYNLTMGDVVKMQVYLVADKNKENKMDFKGFMEGYTQFFGTAEQPNMPVRSTFQVAALAK
ncbi:RidA family protein, partial [Pelistega indica]